MHLSRLCVPCVLILSLLLPHATYAAAGDFRFAKRMGGTTYDYANGVAVDGHDRIIVTGFVLGDADMNGDGDHADGGAESATGYGGNDVFFSVYTSTGAFAFARRLGGTSSGDNGHGVATDSGNRIVVAGEANGNADMNGDADRTDGGAESATGYGSTDAFFSVFSSTGGFLFAKRLGGTAGDSINAVAVDGDDRILVVGSVAGDADLNGDGDRTDGGAESSTGYGSHDAFLSVFDAAGTFQFAKRFGSTSSDFLQSVAVDGDDHILLAGVTGGTADLNGDGDSTDGGAESASGYGSYDAFVLQFTSGGTFGFAKRLGGADSDWGYGVAADTRNRIVVTGQVTGNADFNADGDTGDSGESGSGYGGIDGYVAVFDESGTFHFAKRFGGAGSDVGTSIAVDANRNIVIGGYVDGNADVNGDGDASDGGVESSAGYGNADALLSVFDYRGTFKTAKRLGGAQYDYGMAVAVDGDNGWILGGGVDYSGDLNGDGDTSDTAESTEYGAIDAFFSVFTGLDTDVTAPAISSVSPADGSTDAATDGNLVITFTETIDSTGVGTVTLYRSSDNLLVDQFSVRDARVTGSGTDTITLDPSMDLQYATDYHVRISADAFPDIFDNFFPGIADSVTWNFTTASPAVTSAPSAQTGGGGGRRGGPGRGGVAQSADALRRTDAAAESARAAAPESKPPASLLELRTCDRVMKWFRGNAKMLGRANARLEKRYGFTCGE